MKRMTDATTRHYGARLSTFARVAALSMLAVAAICAASKAVAQTPPPLTFTLETTTGADKKSVIPRLTWSTSPAGATCVASGSWSGNKAASGTEVLTAVTTSQAYTLKCDWPGTLVAKVTWEAPTQNQDGTAYTNPGGYRIDYGRSSTNMDTAVYIDNPDARSWTSPTLAAGGWCFTVRAYNIYGLEGDPFAPPKCNSFSAGASDSRTLNLGITIPKPPTNVNLERQAPASP
jgi:hypothetical protein